MKKLLFISFLLASSIIATSSIRIDNNVSLPTISVKDSVYICNSSSSYAYHNSSNCSGLNRCNHGILKVSSSDAVNKYSRRACKVCY